MNRAHAPPFFEGWYYKLVDHEEEHPLAVMPCLCLTEDSRQSHAFVQVYHGTSGQTTFCKYPLKEFRSTNHDFDVRIGPNQFSAERILLDLETEESCIRGDLTLRDLTPWPSTWVSPGIMGWYSWVPFMQCYHGIVSLDHAIHGTIDLDGQAICFDNGRGYTEKDWGRSFPEAWIWFQCNHFSQTGTSLTGSVAIIPWLRRPFAGFIIGLWHNGRLYRFATYTGAKIKAIDVKNEQIKLTVEDKHHRLEMHVIGAGGHSLRGPTSISMEGRVVETLGATIHVKLQELNHKAECEIFRDIGHHAGMEAMGDTQRLMNLSTMKK
ncbi:MAG: hypothetical protein JXM70_13425 [Pirellulales bacterium]|nr:hypothetical protein [Pirellulales bacterium]